MTWNNSKVANSIRFVLCHYYPVYLTKIFSILYSYFFWKLAAFSYWLFKVYNCPTKDLWEIVLIMFLVNIAGKMLHFILKTTFVHFPLHCMINLFNVNGQHKIHIVLFWLNLILCMAQSDHLYWGLRNQTAGNT